LQACLTQLAEYRFCKPNVIGSTPIVGYFILDLFFAEGVVFTFFFEFVLIFLVASTFSNRKIRFSPKKPFSLHKRVDKGPTSTHNKERGGIVVQWLEHRPVTAEVAGSNPVNLVYNNPDGRINLKFHLGNVGFRSMPTITRFASDAEEMKQIESGKKEVEREGVS